MTEEISQFKVINEGDPGYPDDDILPSAETQVEKNNRFIWDALKRPPKEALKKIVGGRLGKAGMTDINPQWRYMAITDVFGPCGVGWKYAITKLWTEPGSGGQVIAFAMINFYYKTASLTSSPIPDDVWSDPVPGIGGSMLIAQEKSGPHSNDEAYKMAVTDALSVALKMIGTAADIYAGRWDGSTFYEEPEYINDDQFANINALIKEVGADEARFVKYMNVADLDHLPAARYNAAIKALEAKRK